MKRLYFKGFLKTLLKMELKNPEPSKQRSRGNMKKGVKHLNEELVEKIFVPGYFTDRALEV